MIAAVPTRSALQGALQRPGVWFWAILAAGAACRVFLAVATRGTSDALLWTRFAHAIAQGGLVELYFAEPQFNHPPFIGLAMGQLWQLAHALGVEFRVAFRLAVAAIDFASIYLLYRLLLASPWRFVACALYAIAPIALVLSGFHGNTDPIAGFLVLAAILTAAARRPVLCGLVIGFSAWIKVPALIAAPAIGFAFPRWRDRTLCGAVALALAASGYLPAILQADTLARAGAEAVRSTGGNVVLERIFAYHGYHVANGADPPLYAWGTKNLFVRWFGTDTNAWPGWAMQWMRHNATVALSLILLLSFLRRRRNDARGLAITVAGVYALFYGLVETCTFQYFAWSMVLWLAAGASFALCANLLAGGYVYWLYATVCGDWLLRNEWAFVDHEVWPPGLIWLPLVAQLAFLAFAMRWLAEAARDEWRAT